MKALGIVGSYRKGGINDSAVELILQGVASRGVTTEKVFLADKKIHYCRNCRSCAQQPGTDSGNHRAKELGSGQTVQPSSKGAESLKIPPDQEPLKRLKRTFSRMQTLRLIAANLHSTLWSKTMSRRHRYVNLTHALHLPIITSKYLESSCCITSKWHSLVFSAFFQMLFCGSICL